MRWDVRRNTRAIVAMVIALAGAAPALAQFPGAPAAPAAPGIPGVPAAPAAPAIPGTAAAPAAPSNIWSKILPTADQKAACKKAWCECCLQPVVSMMVKPLMFATGGLIKPCCPGPDQADPADLEKPADSADGAAARIKEDEAGAKERRANVRYLGTVDCTRYPEAEKALINALRTDRNECVRWEAAIVLGHGCCCTRKTIEALRLTVEASDKDGNPKENSARVRCAAEASLAACQGQADLTPEPPEKNPATPKKEEPEGGSDEARVRRRIRPVPVTQSVIQQASLQTPAPTVGLVSLIRSTPTPAVTPQAPIPQAATSQTRVPTGQRGLIDIIRRGFAGTEPPRE
jgi:hypothetical protein